MEGKEEGGFRNLNPLFMMFRKMWVFLQVGRSFQIETKSGSETCGFQRVKPLPRCHFVDSVCKRAVRSSLPTFSQFCQEIKRSYLSVRGS